MGRRISRAILTLLLMGACLSLHSQRSLAEESRIPDPIQRSNAYAKRPWYHVYERPSPVLRKSRWEVVPEVYWFFYEEPSLSVEMEGVMYGIRTSFTVRPEASSVMARFEGRYSTGDSDYDGSLSDGTPHTETDENFTYELRGLLGWDWVFERTVITPFVGLGYRYWFNDGESQFAYERNIRYVYSPAGVESVSFLNENWVWGVRAEYDLFWKGWVKSHLNDVNPSFNIIDNAQDSGFGVRGAVYFRRIVNDKVSISIEPFIRHWDIDDSDTAPVIFAGALVGGGFEPANKTIESGLGYLLSFKEQKSLKDRWA